MQLFRQMLGPALAALAVLVADISAQASSSGSTVVVGGATYFVPPSPSAQLQLGSTITANGSSLTPFTFIATNGSKFTPADLAATVANFTASDDVFTSAFLDGIYLFGSGSANVTTTVLPGNGTTVVLTSSTTPLSKPLPPGPYLVDALGNVFEAWLLYDDIQQAFVYGTVPDGKGGYKQLPARIDDVATVSVGVPSRLYFTPTPDKPLAGARLAVKDIFDVQGLRTGCGNRAFLALNPPRNATCPSVQRLLDGGAILVGKTKPSQFANGEAATNDWVDFHAPYNPRGEGYQDASSSSTGSGAALAAYPWLDYAIGSDTSGSMRGPAGVNGLYGNRPSQGAVPLDGVMPLSPSFDTAGIFARSAQAWKTAGDWWYQNFTQFPTFPKKILFPVDVWGSSFLATPPKNGSSDALFNTFITKLEGFLNTTRTEINLTTLWNMTSPLIANVSNPPPPLSVTLNTTYADIATVDQFNLLAQPFISGYKAAFGGQTPFVDPAPLIHWAWGQNLTDPTGRRAAAMNNKTVYTNWFQNTVIGSDKSSCSESIFIYPQSSGRTAYRNSISPSPPVPPLGFTSSRFAVISGTPDYVVPVADLPYNSTITLTTHFLPIAISFIAQKNCDLMLLNLFAALEDAGIAQTVKTGQSMFS